MKKYKILQFEDELFLADMYKMKFEEYGFEYKHYLQPPADREEFVNLVVKEKPSLISMDIIMPQIDGFTATEMLKADPRTKNIPIFGLSNLGQKEDVDKAFEVGMDNYFITASITPKEYLNAIRTFLENPKKYRLDHEKLTTRTKLKKREIYKNKKEERDTQIKQTLDLIKPKRNYKNLLFNILVVLLWVSFFILLIKIEDRFYLGFILGVYIVVLIIATVFAIRKT